MKSQRVPLVREIKEMDMCIFCMCVRVCASVCVLVWDFFISGVALSYFKIFFFDILGNWITVCDIVKVTRCKINAEN